MTNETKIKIGLANKGKGGRCRKNYNHSKETIEKIRNSNIGKKRSIKTKMLQSKLKKGNKNALGHIKTDEAKEKIRLKNIGRISPRKGAILTQETKDKISIGKKGKTCTDEARLNYSIASKKKWINPEFARKVLCVNSPNMEEIKLNNILQEILPKVYKFVGDGKIVIERKIPDFINNDKTKLIELFGEFYHKKEDEQLRINFFKKLGYQTLVVWASELKNKQLLKNKILKFNYA